MKSKNYNLSIFVMGYNIGKCLNCNICTGEWESGCVALKYGMENCYLVVTSFQVNAHFEYLLCKNKIRIGVVKGVTNTYSKEVHRTYTHCLVIKGSCSRNGPSSAPSSLLTLLHFVTYLAYCKWCLFAFVL